MVVVSIAISGEKYEVNGSKDFLECPSVSIECVTHFTESKYQQNLFVLLYSFQLFNFNSFIDILNYFYFYL